MTKITVTSEQKEILTVWDVYRKEAATENEIMQI
jgi:hypothetical protein